jgi:hypothetical protein
MNISELNWLAILLGTLTIFVFNAIWFGPKTFYPVWWAAMGKEPTKPEDQDTSGKTMARLFGGGFAAALAQAIVLCIMVQGASAHFEMSVVFGATIGLALGVVAAGASLAHRLFGQQGFKVWIIEVAADILALVAAGAVIAALVTA